MLAIPAAESIRAKLFSAAADSSAMPSSSSWAPETDNSTPASLSAPRALWSSLHAVSYCFLVRGCPKSYIRANLSRILRLRTKARAAAGGVLACMATVWGSAPPLPQIWGLGSLRTMVLVSCPVLPVSPIWNPEQDLRVQANTRVLFQPVLQLADLSEDSKGTELFETPTTMSPFPASARQDSDERNLCCSGSQGIVDVVAHIKRSRRLPPSEDFYKAFGVGFGLRDVFNGYYSLEAVAHFPSVERVV